MSGFLCYCLCKRIGRTYSLQIQPLTNSRIFVQRIPCLFHCTSRSQQIHILNTTFIIISNISTTCHIRLSYKKEQIQFRYHRFRIDIYTFCFQSIVISTKRTCGKSLFIKEIRIFAIHPQITDIYRFFYLLTFYLHPIFTNNYRFGRIKLAILTCNHKAGKRSGSVFSNNPCTCIYKINKQTTIFHF